MITKRIGLIVWIDDLKYVKKLENLGNILYVSKKLKYVLIYLNEEKSEILKQKIEKYQFVKKVEKSLRKEIPTEFAKVKNVELPLSIS